jgi:hypothetical protein
MWKLLFLAWRGRKLVPREHRRKVYRAARVGVRKHGPTVAKTVGGAVRQARNARRGGA